MGSTLYPVKLYYAPKKPFLSRAFKRILDGINLTKPSNVSFVENPNIADLIIKPIVNYKDVDDLAEDAIIWQLCYKTAGENLEFWNYVWRKAKLVISYFDLPVPPDVEYKFLRMPLGYDPNIFQALSTPRTADVLTTGYMDGKGHEVIREFVDVFEVVHHIGRNFKYDKGYLNHESVSDRHLVELYNDSRFVSGLRYIEGFELPVVEGMACGCVPIIFDMECYTHWYRYAVTINPQLPITQQLIQYGRDINEELYDFLREYNKEEAKNFTWQKVMIPFWERILKLA